MSTWAISTVKDEADVIEGMVRHMADEVDHLLVLDNGSSDGTREILADLESELPLTVVDDDEIGYYQSRRMSELAAQAHGMGAEWIVPVDADELWVCRRPGRIADVLDSLDPSINVATALLYNHFVSAIDPVDPDPFRSIVWRQRHPGALPKVAFRWEQGAVIHQGNHGVTLPLGWHDQLVLEIRHFPYRSVRQFLHKAEVGAAAYKATDLPEDWGAHWRQYGAILERHGPDALAEVFRTHFYFMSPIDHDMIHDPAPYLRWQ